eukprot:TRINITY_DN49087_c0_g1_i1.p1 TRINITY_DN49087_c0_g1~~TRINITY_DN49087_c0_g1_i1.p1  ORF type:complete len:233 (-),score=27.73 TRINITY_DN49087_c0_g1_i1:11-709(-)
MTEVDQPLPVGRQEAEEAGLSQTTSTQDSLTGFSTGSRGHPISCSDPCKFYRKQRGCKDGDDCDYCHMCTWRSNRARRHERQLQQGEAGQSLPWAEPELADQKAGDRSLSRFAPERTRGVLLGSQRFQVGHPSKQGQVHQADGDYHPPRQARYGLSDVTPHAQGPSHQSAWYDETSTFMGRRTGDRFSPSFSASYQVPPSAGFSEWLYVWQDRLPDVQARAFQGGGMQFTSR